MNIVKLHAEKKTAEISLLTWEISPPALNTPFQVYRALVYGGEYEIVGNGIGTAFVDDTLPIIYNEFAQYKVVSGDAEAEVQMYRQADHWVMAVAADYIWQLYNGYNSSIAVAYCLGKTPDPCPECFSEELNKIVKSTCSLCDGSGKIVSYVGPIPFRYAPLQYARNMANMGNIETDSEMISAWTANIPILNIGDIVINKDHKKFMVQSVPSRIFLHSVSHNDEFVARQNITLRKLDDEEYGKLNYYENMASSNNVQRQP